MWYVYIIRSVEKEFTYVGYTSDVNRRLEQHNAGLNQSTKAYAPFTVEAYVALPSKEKAIELERYFKTGSGRAILKKRFLS